MTPPIVLTIAASDPSGAAGLQADLKTYEARGVYGMSVVTALTAQHSQTVRAFKLMEPEFVAQQITTLLEDFHPAVIKTGMLLSAPIIEAVIAATKTIELSTWVVDPVFVTGEGRRIVDAAALHAYVQMLFPRAAVITPNLDECEMLLETPVRDVDAMRNAAKRLYDEFGARSVLVKGGHLAETAQLVDVLYDGQTFHEFSAPYLPVKNPRGTGCTFASCIAAELAKGTSIVPAVATAKRYVSAALDSALTWQIGHGRGTINHAVGRPPLR